MGAVTSSPFHCSNRFQKVAHCDMFKPVLVSVIKNNGSSDVITHFIVQTGSKRLRHNSMFKPVLVTYTKRTMGAVTSSPLPLFKPVPIVRTGSKPVPIEVTIEQRVKVEAPLSLCSRVHVPEAKQHSNLEQWNGMECGCGTLEAPLSLCSRVHVPEAKPHSNLEQWNGMRLWHTQV
jgi:hypothetical protein